ncbi:MAG TPA: isocitrate lyase/phosphoenolpyruvate mutase family protein [Candidatus Baltobacteraceae bacterium]|nr:isocitrate lyase/phosphoenolpyruvate mutase family protein [Candidatus Baltobacteraceae bacterium]
MQTESIAAAFRALHHGNDVLLLPNAWDAASAAVFRGLGARAIATTSAGLAWACGYADGDVLPRENLLFAVREIKRVVGDLPLSIDIEGGYSDDPAAVADLAEQLVELGVAGVNLEDGGRASSELAAKIEAIVHRCRKNGTDLFVNARCDVYLRDLASGEAAVTETVARGRAYAQAGAGGLFVPGLSEPDAMRAIARDVDVPLAIFAVEGLPPARELFALGVRRLSAGEALAGLAYGAAREAAQAFLRDGNSAAVLTERNLEYGPTNALFPRN